MQERVRAYLELTKPRITFLVLFVSVAGFWLASDGPPDRSRLLQMAVATGMLCGGISALNQYIERDLDARMLRTRNRPLPTGRLKPKEALLFGIVMCLLALISLSIWVNPLSAMLGGITLSSYLFVYTPLKRRTPYCTLVGAIPGAMPPLLGWAAARGQLNVEGWALFSILFLWQFPHFHSIAWLYRDDYSRADIRVWPVVDPHGKMLPRQIVGFTFLLLPASLMPAILHVSGWIYLCGGLVMSVLFLCIGIGTALEKSHRRMQRLLLASVVYLPALFVLMVLDKG